MASVLRRPRLLRGPELAMPVVARERATDRLLLRPYRLTDADDWLQIEGDDVVRRGLEWPQRTERQALEHLRDRTRHRVLRHAGDLLVLAVEREGHVIGDVSLHLRTIAPETRSLEIGWLQRTAACGHGFATEAALAMLDLAFVEAGACLVTAVVHDGNQASARMASRLGFRLARRDAGSTTFLLSRADRCHPTHDSPRTGQTAV